MSPSTSPSPRSGQAQGERNMSRSVRRSTLDGEGRVRGKRERREGTGAAEKGDSLRMGQSLPVPVPVVLWSVPRGEGLAPSLPMGITPRPR
jgi:hypothetical protein